MTIYCTLRSTGERVEVLAFAGDDTVFVSPPGHYAEGRLVPRGALEPDPRLEALRQGFVPWTLRLTGTA